MVDPAAKDRLEHDSSDLVSDLTQLWIFNSMALLDGVLGRACLEEVGPIKECDYKVNLVPVLVPCCLHFSFLKLTK